MQRIKIDKDLVIRFLIIILLVIIIDCIIDLYVPLKRFILGDRMTFYEVISYITFLRHLPAVLLISILTGFYVAITDKKKSV